MKPNSLLKCSGAAALVLVLIGAVGFVSLTWLQRNAERIVTDTLPGLALAGASNADLAQAFNRTLLLLLTVSPEQRARLSTEIEVFSQRTTDHLHEYERQIRDLDDRTNFDRLITARTNYLAIRSRMMMLAETNRHSEAVIICQEELLPAYTAYKEAGEALFRYNRAQGELQSRRIMTACRYTRLAVAFITVVVFVGGFVAGLGLTTKEGMV